MLDTFKIGEDIRVSLRLTKGLLADVDTITVRMIQALSDGGMVKPGVSAIPTTVVPRAAVGRVPAGWDVIVLGADTAAMVKGIYMLDAKIIMADATEITNDTAYITLTGSAFG